MDPFPPDSPVALYWQSLQQRCPSLDPAILNRVLPYLEAIAWEEPESAYDLNTAAVMTLIEADQLEGGEAEELRSINLEIALDAFAQGAELQEYPLCVAHLAVAHLLAGNLETANQLAFATFLTLLHGAYSPMGDTAPLGLVYWPASWRGTAEVWGDRLSRLLQARNGYEQALLLCAEILYQLQLAFYTATGLRALRIITPVAPDAVDLNLKSGISSVMNQLPEGLWFLHQAQALAPQAAAPLQALYLAYGDRNQPDQAQAWLETARQRATDSVDWKWTALSTDAPFTYLPFDQTVLLAVDSSFRSIVTAVLLAEGDWFEAEMAFWRDQIQPGMTVIDVGANVGVYTFSAALRVGASGRVLAVEPFSRCVQCLKETCRVNPFSWVTVCAGAASDRTSTARLSLHSASELNAVITEDTPLTEGAFEEIPCFTLDSLIDQEGLTRVDWLKIDAEGHEMQVLMGSDRLLSEFAPSILYENLAGAQTSNLPVAEFLQSKGYHLFRYHPYLKTLIPVESIDSLKNSLNIIALPPRQSE